MVNRKIFCDFGKNFEVFDVNGNQPSSSLIVHISNDKEAIVSVFDENRHGFEDGTVVKFQKVEGMSEINEGEYKIKVLGKKQKKNFI